ncbi:MAG: WecB/TagA/CpsF family glycosyltransferase [Fimbriimonadaceae bacterium]
MVMEPAATPAKAPETRDVLGVPVGIVSMASTLELARQWLREDQSRLLLTSDSQGIYLAQTDPELKAIYQRAALNTPDSYGVVWALRRQGIHLEDRVTGVDLVSGLCEIAAQEGKSVYLLGSSPGVAEKAARALQDRYNGLKIAGARDGYYPAYDEAEVVKDVAATRPDILLVAMGIPRQEKFLAKYQEQIGFRIGMGIGGSLDVLSGNVKRAPKIVQAVRMEWLWRVILNPKKISKVATLPKFAMCVLRGRTP